MAEDLLPGCGGVLLLGVRNDERAFDVHDTEPSAAGLLTPVSFRTCVRTSAPADRIAVSACGLAAARER